MALLPQASSAAMWHRQVFRVNVLEGGRKNGLSNLYNWHCSTHAQNYRGQFYCHHIFLLKNTWWKYWWSIYNVTASPTTQAYCLNLMPPYRTNTSNKYSLQIYSWTWEQYEKVSPFLLIFFHRYVLRWLAIHVERNVCIHIRKTSFFFTASESLMEHKFLHMPYWWPCWQVCFINNDIINTSLVHGHVQL